MHRHLLSHLMKKLLHIVLAILKSDSADVNCFFTLLRLMQSKHCKFWSVFQWYLFQIPFWGFNLSGKPWQRWEDQQRHYEFSTLQLTYQLWSILPLYKVTKGKSSPQMRCGQRRIRINKIHLLLGDG